MLSQNDQGFVRTNPVVMQCEYACLVAILVDEDTVNVRRNRSAALKVLVLLSINWAGLWHRGPEFISFV